MAEAADSPRLQPADSPIRSIRDGWPLIRRSASPPVRCLADSSIGPPAAARIYRPSGRRPMRGARRLSA
ncbi:hypothetical protein AQ477_26740 [Burkholderia thailandensis]|nr:hypothetical protein AQ477_26740 [Burkholderia thailandensis]KXF59444.1 hypothetical protein AQ476_19685 [Burkholderia thailandensis]